MAKSKYKTVIVPRMDEIKEWVSQGLTDKEIVKRLGISHSTWYKHKNEIFEFSDTIRTFRKPKVEELEQTAFILATGYTKKVTKYMKVKNADGGESLEPYEEEIYISPNYNMIKFLLCNWSSDKYQNDPALMKQRKKEFEHKKEIDEQNSW